MFNAWALSPENNSTRTDVQPFGNEILLPTLSSEPFSRDIFSGMIEFPTYTPPPVPKDLQIHSLHCKVRDLLQLLRNKDHAQSDTRERVQMGIQIIEEVTESLQNLPADRTLFLLGVAAIWDATELSGCLSIELLRPIATNGQETSASTTVTNARQHAHARPAHERAPSLSQLLSTIPPSIRSKPTSDLVQITRLEMCLSDFFNYLVGIENIAKNIDGLHAQSALDTRMSIATLQERISSIKHSMTNPWSTNSQNLRWM
jgi:hypothetical protein